MIFVVSFVFITFSSFVKITSFFLPSIPSILILFTYYLIAFPSLIATAYFSFIISSFVAIF